VRPRIAETLVFGAPAVASAGRDVAVTQDSADRPVQARTRSGASMTGAGAPNARMFAGDVKAGCMHCKLAL
jgi:hypothetical protein